MFHTLLISPNPVGNSLTSSTISTLLAITCNWGSNPPSDLIQRKSNTCHMQTLNLQRISYCSLQKINIQIIDLFRALVCAIFWQNKKDMNSLLLNLYCEKRYICRNHCSLKHVRDSILLFKVKIFGRSPSPNSNHLLNDITPILAYCILKGSLITVSIGRNPGDFILYTIIFH